jgi:hypothetical protein
MFVLKKSVSIAVAFTALWCSLGASQASPKHPIPTTLCDVLSHSTRWDSKLISVPASYFDGGWPGGPVLADDRCEAGVVEVTFADHRVAERLDSSMPSDSLGTFDHSVQATWIGQFHANHGKFHATFLEVQRTTNLSVTAVDFSKSDASPISTGIEEVVTHPRVYNHKTIAFHSRFESDGMHGSMVFECGTGNIGRGIPIKSTAGASGEKALDDALRQGGPGTLDKTIEAEWIGRLSWSPNPPPFHSVYRIQITAIRNLTVSMHANYIQQCGSESESRPPQR